MGLRLSVGYIAEVKEADPEGVVMVRNGFERLNEFICSQGLPPHREPEEIIPFSCQMWGYSGLHYLRRTAVHLARSGALPPPGDENASKDPLLLERYATTNGSAGWFSRLLGRSAARERFVHLIDHSDAEGYYLPSDFSRVLFAPAGWQIPGGYIGSAPRLLQECEEIARALELPLDLDIEADEVWSAPDSQGRGDVRWRRYGVESFSCLRLHAAARHSVQTSAALVFC